MHRATCLTSVQTVLRAPLKEAGGWKIALSLLLHGHYRTFPILLVTQAVSPGERVHLALLYTACASSLFCSILLHPLPRYHTLHHSGDANSKVTQGQR